MGGSVRGCCVAIIKVRSIVADLVGAGVAGARTNAGAHPDVPIRRRLTAEESIFNWWTINNRPGFHSSVPFIDDPDP